MNRHGGEVVYSDRANLFLKIEDIENVAIVLETIKKETNINAVAINVDVTKAGAW